MARTDHRCAVLLLGVPAPGQPLRRRTGRATSCTSRCAGSDGDAADLLREFAVAADREADGAKGARWSFRRDFGSVRLLVIDSRCGRILDEGRRSMLSDAEFDWIGEQLDGDYDHLLIGTSLPWLLPRALPRHRGLERAAVRRPPRRRDRRRLREDPPGSRSRALGGVPGILRAAGVDDRGGGRGEHTAGEAPATVCVLSGDVHHAYVARAEYSGVQSAVYQLTCSPLHNHVPAPMRLAFRAAWSRVAERTTRRLLGLVTKVPTPSVEWTRLSGPYFGNDLMTLRLDGRHAQVLLEQAGAACRSPPSPRSPGWHCPDGGHPPISGHNDPAATRLPCSGCGRSRFRLQWCPAGGGYRRQLSERFSPCSSSRSSCWACWPEPPPS